MTNGLEWLVVISAAVVYPLLVVAYFARFKQHRDEIVDVLKANKETAEVYARAYKFRSVEAKASEERWRQLVDLEGESYILPLFLLAVSSGTWGLICAAHMAVGLGHKSSEAFNLLARVPLGVITGFGGAYIWGLYDSLERFRILNWTPTSLYSTWVRLLVGAVLGDWATVVVKDDYASLFAFAVGTFPVETTRKWLQGIAIQRAGISQDKGTEQGPSWSLLQGATPQVIERLAEADVTTPAHLANVDPVTIFARTNIGWRNVLDLMDQAFLAIYIGDKIEKVRVAGIRGSIEMAFVWERLHSADAAVVEAAQRTVQALVEAVGVQESAVLNLIRNLDEDPQVDLLWSLWFERPKKDS
jgi:hypothetical protein